MTKLRLKMRLTGKSESNRVKNQRSCHCNFEPIPRSRSYNQLFISVPGEFYDAVKIGDEFYLERKPTT